MRAQMGQRIVNKNVDRARNDVIGGRTEIAFLANDLAFSITMQNGRGFRPVLQLRPRHFFQRREISDELVDAQRFARRKFFNYFGHMRSPLRS